MSLKRISQIVLALLWLSTLTTALLWAFAENPPFDPEPITVILGLLSTATTALLTEYASRLEQESFSPAYALAHGYMNNFIEPVITQLLRTYSSSLLLYIYVPEKLSELEPRSIDRIMARIREKNFSDKIVNLEFAEGRARDVLSIQKIDGQSVFFDFPSTLLTLSSFLDYKMKLAKNPSPENRELWAKQYIAKFRGTVQEIMTEKGLSQHIRFIDKDLNF